MRFSDIDCQGLRGLFIDIIIKFWHISTGNGNMVAWKPEVHFRKSAKSCVPQSKSPD